MGGGGAQGGDADAQRHSSGAGLAISFSRSPSSGEQQHDIGRKDSAGNASWVVLPPAQPEAEAEAEAEAEPEPEPELAAAPAPSLAPAGPSPAAAPLWFWQDGSGSVATEKWTPYEPEKCAELEAAFASFGSGNQTDRVELEGGQRHVNMENREVMRQVVNGQPNKWRRVMRARRKGALAYEWKGRVLSDAWVGVSVTLNVDGSIDVPMREFEGSKPLPAVHVPRAGFTVGLPKNPREEKPGCFRVDLRAKTGGIKKLILDAGTEQEAGLWLSALNEALICPECRQQPINPEPREHAWNYCGPACGRRAQERLAQERLDAETQRIAAQAADELKAEQDRVAAEKAAAVVTAAAAAAAATAAKVEAQASCIDKADEAAIAEPAPAVAVSALDSDSDDPEPGQTSVGEHDAATPTLDSQDRTPHEKRVELVAHLDKEPPKPAIIGPADRVEGGGGKSIAAAKQLSPKKRKKQQGGGGCCGSRPSRS